MKKLQITILILLLVGSIQVQAELQFVIEIYRHGARGPLGDWYDAREQKYTYGELTATGQRQHYNLGAQLRKEYSGFLPDSYNHTQIYVRSTDYNRTLMSAASQLQGMFPAGTGDVLPDNLAEQYTLPAFANAQNYLKSNYSLPNNIQVLPIHTQPRVGDKVLSPESNCKNYKQIISEFYKEKQSTVDFINKQFEQTYQQYSKAIYQEVKNFDNQHYLESVFECDRANGRYVPDFTQELKDNSTYLTSLSWNFLFNQPDLLRALNQPFFSSFLEYTDPVVKNNNTSGLKWVMFSAHDTNIQLISAALNFTSIDCLLALRFEEYRKKDQVFYNCEYYPHFTSNIIFELHLSDKPTEENGVKIQQNQYYLKIRRDGKFMKLCDKNSTICSYSEFNQRIQQFMLNFDTVCQNVEQKNQETTQKAEDYSTYYIVGLILQSIIIAGCAFYIFQLLQKQKSLLNFEQFKDIEAAEIRNSQ
ncbi:histidine acid phosphatase family protein (macronuclear) [Tetrahymena thermophila SB210]|uniref:Histidine acid phosphatase family protein n=1 Tax=Tetrahymena thermophila (strain SB210) TaxID=312017 RepID=W7X1M7_TETTS|nr:histidine acid phosphatase family protein [Tetrahymena thermophila SB210]EWS71522.1 histidine acid phosphatase family protein [Tetrahymena thermophila SB210]|eukprot:XP_012655933.1 histidine acid phosphatase family protein [Tetrahymena thermophila SB210]